MPPRPDISGLFTPYVPKVKKPGAFKITDDIVSDALNRGTVGDNRNRDKKDYLIHVSDLCKTDKPFEFCARQHVFNYHSIKVRNSGGSLPPGRELLFATGHFLGDYVVRKFIKNSPFARYAYGDWVCNCKGHWLPDFKGIKYRGTYGDLNPANVCTICNAANDNYAEIDLISEKFDLVGHPDLLLLYNGKFIVYEFKSVDRTDINFDDINQPFADHVLQASFYFYIMTELKMDVSQRVRVLYIDRSNKKLLAGEPYKEFHPRVVALDEITQFTDKLNAVTAGKKSGFLPPRICQSIKAARGKNCEFLIECFERRGQYAKPGVTRTIEELFAA